MKSQGTEKGASFEIGSVSFTVHASSKETGGGFALLEFYGSEGPWTVPHIHKTIHESFYVLAGSFIFTVEGKDIEGTIGSYILIPPGVSHVFRAGEEGGRLLALVVPGGLEEMFKELSLLPGESLTDPEIRAKISARYDSHPV